MELKGKMTKSVKEAKACLQSLTSGGIVGVKNCQNVSIIWTNLCIVEELAKLIPEEDRSRNETAEDQMEGA